jgi:hypothetical protein
VVPERWPQETQDLLMQLVTWECLNNLLVDPKLILRQISLGDLSILHTNVTVGDTASIERFVVVKMIKVELLYRMGKLKGDWTYLRLGEKINLRYTMDEGDLVSQFHQVDSAASVQRST